MGSVVVWAMVIPFRGVHCTIEEVLIGITEKVIIPLMQWFPKSGLQNIFGPQDFSIRSERQIFLQKCVNKFFKQIFCNSQ